MRMIRMMRMMKMMVSFPCNRVTKKTPTMMRIYMRILVGGLVRERVASLIRGRMRVLVRERVTSLIMLLVMRLTLLIKLTRRRVATRQKSPKVLAARQIRPKVLTAISVMYQQVLEGLTERGPRLITILMTPLMTSLPKLHLLMQRRSHLVRIRIISCMQRTCGRWHYLIYEIFSEVEACSYLGTSAILWPDF
jgi:hypothetical protein